jgi:FkbM family methyltransferase
MWLSLTDYHVSYGCLLDNYEASETNFLRDHLSNSSVFLDVGANVGWFTIVASTIISELGHIHSFEPSADSFLHLSRTISDNGLQKLVTLHNVALSNRAGEAFIVSHKGTNNPGGSFISDRPLTGFENCSAQTVTLDSLQIPKVDVIKIDAEGAELLIVNGGISTIRRDMPIILSEINISGLRSVSGVSASEYIRLLCDLGYDVISIDARAPGKRIVEMPPNWPGNLINVACIPR